MTPDFTTEQQYLLDILGCFIEGRNFDAEIPPSLDAGKFHGMVRHHNIGPVCHYMRPRGADSAELECWGKLRTMTMLANMRAQHVIARLFSYTDAAGIKMAVMRGLSLCGREYADISLRMMHDVDLLVAADQAAAFESVMADRGYMPVERLRSQLVYVVDDVCIEAHLRLLTSRRYNRRTSSDFMLAGLLSQQLPDGEIRTLSLEAEFVGLVTHALVHHDLKRMAPLVDMALMLKHSSIDWQIIADFSHKAGLSRIFVLAISLTAGLFGMDVSSILNRFNISQGWADSYLPAYKAQLFGELDFGSYMQLQKSLVVMAESPLLKLGQLMRFFSPENLRVTRAWLGGRKRNK